MSETRTEETKILYYRDNDDEPTLIRLNIPPERVTLSDFKAAIHLKPGCHKFFFKTTLEDVGIVKEEISKDDAKLPVFKGNIVCYIVSESYDDSNNYSHPHHHHRCNYNSPVMSSDVDSTTFVDSDLDDDDDDDSISRISTTTDETSVSRINASRLRRKQRRKHRMPALSRTSSISSITDSTISLNIITVTLNLDPETNFLGMSLVGQSNNHQDGGIYVGSIMKGGAVANDGRIHPGDMILQVNDINFDNMSNDQAVEVLREAVQKPGKIKLVVAKCWDNNPKSYFTIPRGEPVQPIDLEAWVNHTEAARATGEYPMRPPSVSTLTSTSSFAESEQRQLIPGGTELSVESDMLTIAKAMAKIDSGLEVKDRMWLKIAIPNAFLGSDVVTWLFESVRGFQDKKEARKYASQMLKSGYIKPVVSNKFKEECYYVFDKTVTNDIADGRYDDDYDEGRHSLLDGFRSLQINNSSNSPSHWPPNNGSIIPNYANTDGYLPQYWAGETNNYAVYGGRGPGSGCGSGGHHTTVSDRQSVSPGVSSEQTSQIGLLLSSTNK